MKKFTIVLVSLVTQLSFAQIGIGNTNPQSTLDISTSNAMAPSNTDGILIPRIDNFPATNPTATQDGMMVFYTGIAASGKGFYYWNQTMTSWIFMSGAKRINELLDGKTTTSSLFLGENVGVTETAGNRKNTGIGYLSMQNMTSGDDNTAFGHSSLNSNTTGTSNTAVGERALFSNDSGGENSAFGKLALAANTDGLNNTAMGNLSLSSNTQGDVNVAIGHSALRSNNGGANTALGANALEANTTGHGNTSVGSYSFQENTVGYNNVSVGDFSGRYVDGNNNVFVGRRAGANNFIANPSNNKSNNIMIGYEAGFNQLVNNRLFIENSNSANPLIYGEFDTDIVRINGDLQVGNPFTTGYALPNIDGTAGQVMTTDGAGQVSFTTVSATDTQNTLDQAYDEGGAGAGRTITADNGALIINGTDGLQVTGSYLLGTPLALNGTGIRMFFYPKKAAFRAGLAIFTDWDDVNIGLYSSAFNQGTLASGINSTAFGLQTEALGPTSASFGSNTSAQGSNSISAGSYTEARSYSETAIGSNNRLVAPMSTNSFDALDQVFSIGNGTNSITRSNALTIYKSGLMNINDEYNMPLTDGTANQVMTTDGSGNVSWANAIGSSNTASNGLTLTGSDIQLGGTLNQYTTINHGNNNLRFDLTGTGDFMVLDNGTIEFIVEDSGDVGIGTNNPNYLLDVNETDNSEVIAVNIQKTDNTATFNTAAMRVTKSAAGSGSSSVITTFADGTGYGEQRGVYNILNGTGTGNKFGIKNELTSASGGLQYGMQSNFSGATSSPRYAISNQFTAGTGGQTGVYNNFDNNTSNADTAMLSIFYSTNISPKTGVANSFALNSGGNHVGFSNTFAGNSDTEKIGLYSNFNSVARGTLYGAKVDMNSTGVGTKYGVYIDFNAAVTGTNNYGVYSSVNPSIGWAGYFMGNSYISNKLGIGTGATNPDGFLEVRANNTGAQPNVNLIDIGATGARINFTNTATTNGNVWTLYGDTDDTNANSVFNIYHPTAGNIIEIFGDSQVEINGQLSVNLNNPTYAIHLPNNATAGIGQGRANAWTTYSDNRLKSNQITIQHGLTDILKMYPKSYFHHNSSFEEGHLLLQNDGENTVGFIAQELFEVLPEAVQKPEDEQAELWSINYDKVVPVVVKAIQELNDKVVTLKAENETLKAQLSKYEQLESRLSALEKNNTKTDEIILASKNQ